MLGIRRRDVISLLGGAAAWPLAVWAQAGERMRRVGVLMNLAADDPDGPPRITAFAQGLQENGWAVGRNVRIDYRWSVDSIERSRMAAELGPVYIHLVQRTVATRLMMAAKHLSVFS